MRLHLLEHDPDDFSKTNITAWAAKKGYKVSKTDVFKMEALPSLSNFDWLMIMGGAQHAWEEDAHPWLVNEKQFIKRVLADGKIVLGICFGAQLLGEALGGQVLANKHREIGWYSVFLSNEGKKSFLFKNAPETFLTFHWHSDHFSLPAGCTQLAFSKSSPNQAFIHNELPFVGLQFHPEYTLDMVRSFSRQYGHEWLPGPFVAGKEALLAKTEKIPETYWLMETLLDNMVQIKQFRESVKSKKGP